MRVAAVVLALVPLAPLTAAADPTNRNLVPFGERAAMLGNAGITSPYGESIFYNPANLQRVGYPSLSVTGSTYLVYQIAVDPIFVLEGGDQPFEASGFVAIPSTVVSTYQIGRLALANAVLVPEALTFKNRASFEGSSSRVTILQEIQHSQLWIGGGAALEIADGVYVGLSVFVANTTENSLEYLRVQDGLMPVVSLFEQTSSTDVSVFGVNAIAGIQIQRGRLGIGARVHSPSLRIRGSGDLYVAQAQLSATMQDSREDALEDLRVDRPLPLDTGLGISVQAAPTLLVLADVNLQLPARLTLVDDPRVERVETKLRLAPRGSLGMEWELLSNKWIRAGLMLNRSANPTPNSSADAAREDYMGGSLGFAWQSGRTQTALGAFYLAGAVKTFVQGIDPPRRADASSRLFGGILSVSYRL